MSYFQHSSCCFHAVVGESRLWQDFNIYANNYRKHLKEANANSHMLSIYNTQHPIDYNEKAYIFDSRNKAIKMLVW